MDTINSIKTTHALPVGVKSQRKGSQASSASLRFSNYSRKSILQSRARRRSPPLIVAVVNTEPRGSKNSGVRMPLEPTSPEGKFLSSVLHNHRHLFPFAVSQQLDEMATNRDEAAVQKMLSPSCMESVLHKRIAEIKDKERQTAVEDVIYMSIVHKFSEIGVPMVPELSGFNSDNGLEASSSSSKCRELESIHSLEVQEMLDEHVVRVLRMRGKSFLPEGSTTTQIDRLDLGRIYAASVMYGYFLKSAAFRRQMDTSLVNAQEDLRQVHGYNKTCSTADSYVHGFLRLVTFGQSTDTQLLELCHGLQTSDTEPENLKSYVMGFDARSLQRSAKLKSQEAVNVIEKHTLALFGGENKDEPKIVVTFPSLERLVLEAAAFGTFLWDVERSVDSTYTLKKN